MLFLLPTFVLWIFERLFDKKNARANSAWQARIGRARPSTNDLLPEKSLFPKRSAAIRDVGVLQKQGDSSGLRVKEKGLRGLFKNGRNDMKRLLGLFCALTFSMNCQALTLSLDSVVEGNSFTQNWFFGSGTSFNVMMLEFVSQTPAQPGWLDVGVQASADPSWSTTYVLPTKSLFKGDVGVFLSFFLTFDGDPSDHIEWNLWAWRDGGIVGGLGYSGPGSGDNTYISSLRAEDAPAVPYPSAAVLSLAGLACLCGRRRRGLA